MMKKVIIKIDSQQEQKENLKNSRKTLKVLQQTASDKENLVGRPILDKDAKTTGEKNDSSKKIKLEDKAVQTGGATGGIITAEDLTCGEPSENYWKKLAEKLEISLNESFHEKEKLEETVVSLKEENKICKEMLEESRNLVEVLQEMLEEVDPSAEVAEEAS